MIPPDWLRAVLLDNGKAEREMWEAIRAIEAKHGRRLQPCRLRGRDRSK